MKRYTVQITDAARADMEEIYRYIAEKLRSPGSARGQYNRIADEILSLEVFPERYRAVDFEPERSAGLRRMLVQLFGVLCAARGPRNRDKCIVQCLRHRGVLVGSGTAALSRTGTIG